MKITFAITIWEEEGTETVKYSIMNDDIFEAEAFLKKYADKKEQKTLNKKHE